MPTRVIIYNGIPYRRYEGERYYKPSPSLRRRGYTSLHRQIWLDAGRRIPPGWHIHHKDGDVDHNELENYGCIPVHLHSALHMTGERLERQREIGRRSMENHPERTSSCRFCSGAFTTRHPAQKYCSHDCCRKANRPKRDIEWKTL